MDFHCDIYVTHDDKRVYMSCTITWAVMVSRNSMGNMNITICLLNQVRIRQLEKVQDTRHLFYSTLLLLN